LDGRVSVIPSRFTTSVQRYVYGGAPPVTRTVAGADVVTVPLPILNPDKYEGEIVALKGDLPPAAENETAPDIR
jgi:hypothetical protein